LPFLWKPLGNLKPAFFRDCMPTASQNDFFHCVANAFMQKLICPPGVRQDIKDWTAPRQTRSMRGGHAIRNEFPSLMQIWAGPMHKILSKHEHTSVLKTYRPGQQVPSTLKRTIYFPSREKWQKTALELSKLNLSTLPNACELWLCSRRAEIMIFWSCLTLIKLHNVQKSWYFNHISAYQVAQRAEILIF
jgi:hypothetical protein